MKISTIKKKKLSKIRFRFVLKRPDLNTEKVQDFESNKLCDFLICIGEFFHVCLTRPSSSPRQNLII